MLIVPKAHKENYFELSPEELIAIHDLAHLGKQYAEDTYQAQGFNIGWNCGPAARQNVFPTHCHLIPRYEGDVEKPKGGIRNFKTPLVPY